eukprot:973328_1
MSLVRFSMFRNMQQRPHLSMAEAARGVTTRFKNSAVGKLIAMSPYVFMHRGQMTFPSDASFILPPKATSSSSSQKPSRHSNNSLSNVQSISRPRGCPPRDTHLRA